MMNIFGRPRQLSLKSWPSDNKFSIFKPKYCTQIGSINVPLSEGFNQTLLWEKPTGLLFLSFLLPMFLCYFIFLCCPICLPFMLPQNISYAASSFKSLRTPNANSVRHLIRHINSKSPLNGVILLQSDTCFFVYLCVCKNS